MYTFGMLNSSEYIQVVDKDDNVIGKKLRSQITKDDIYRVSSLWIFNKYEELMIAQRPLWKKHDPGKWSESVVGTVEDGETYESNLIKEALEELGLSLDIKDLTFVAKDYYETKKGKLFGCMYAIQLENEPDLKLNIEEVPDVEWISNEKVLMELQSQSNRFVGSFRKFYVQVCKKIFD